MDISRLIFLLSSIATAILAVPHGGGNKPCPPPALPSSGLPAPTGLNLRVITLGIGHQNYTCNATTGTFGSNVALASLFDATHYLSKHPDQVSQLSADALRHHANTGGCEERPNVHPQLEQIGEHYFEVAKPSPIPDFDLYSLGDFLSAKKSNNVSAPSSNDIDWLYLVDNGNGKSKGLKAVYRVETAGGKPPTSCTGNEQKFVPYAAQYWFYD